MNAIGFANFTDFRSSVATSTRVSSRRTELRSDDCAHVWLLALFAPPLPNVISRQPLDRPTLHRFSSSTALGLFRHFLSSRGLQAANERNVAHPHSQSALRATHD